MRILFLGRRYSYFRNFESVIRALAARGHALHLAVEREEGSGGMGGGRAMVDALAAEYPGVTFGEAPSRADDDWGWVASRLRLGLDYLRYQHRVFDDTPKLRARARERTPGAFVALGDAVRMGAPWLRPQASALLRHLERAVPGDPAIDAYVEAQRPDLVLLTPLIDLGSSQIDYLRAARARGIPTALAVWSWDHLSSKALIREWPERVFVWNETQRREATELHGVPADRVVVTGAQCFDQWFDREPSRDRETFCRQVGLPPRPFLLYVCSALFHGSPSEAAFVLDWIRALRASGSERLRTVPILVRPHPSRTAEWDGAALDGLGDVVVWGGNPVDAVSRADYFDSLFHSAAVVGLNTSAFIEAAIVGRPVYTLLLPEFHENQMGTVHFRYLLDAGGGLLNTASDMSEHARQLDAALASPETRVTPFVRAFVRPHGLNVAATPVFVEAVEAMRGLPVHAPAGDRVTVFRRPALAALARLRHSVRAERWTCSERELEGIVRLRDFGEAKARAAEERRSRRDAAARQRQAERERRDAAAQAARAARLDAKKQQAAEKQARLAAHRAAKREVTRQGH